jgi:hypothetical protein
MRLALCCALLLPLHVFGSQAKTRPSLDLLLERVNAYWSLLVAGKKAEALEFVDRESRGSFDARRTPAFSEPRVSRLEPGSTGVEVFVTVTIKRVLPPISAPFDWPVTEKWAFHEGNWFVTIPKSSSLFSTQFSTQSPGEKAPRLSPEEAEQRRKAIRDALQFQTTVLDFGTVRQGERATLPLKYRLDWDQAMDVGFKNTPPDLIFRGLEQRKLAAGKSQEIKMELLTQNYDGEVNEAFTILARHQEVEVPYEFKLRAFVYTPVSVSPRVLRFLKGEREHEIVVRNNSKSEVKIASLYSQSSGFKVEPLPQALGPGQESRFKVTHLINRSDTNHQERLALIFAGPVEGMANLSLPVVLNYVERKKKTLKDLTPEDIEKLMRQSRPE